MFPNVTNGADGGAAVLLAGHVGNWQRVRSFDSYESCNINGVTMNASTSPIHS